MSEKTENKNTQKKKALFKILGITSSTLIFGFLTYYYFVGSKHVTTDNAYVGAEIAQVTSEISGTIKQINFTDTQLVNAKDVLVIIDETDTKLALAKAKANLIKVEAEIKQAKDNYKRRKALAESDSVSEEELINSKNNFESAQAAYDAAKVSVDQAKLDLSRTLIYAPISGVVVKRQVQLGQRVQAGAPLMSITPKNEMHVNANFKEVQLRKVKIGQPVTITSDLYGDDVVYHGKVSGFSGGTGAAFSVIPAQNATGNWIKVVQRVPVRIDLMPEELERNPLQVGLSMHVNIDVSK
jgi:membrane fusion protein, multidrug efflux system